MSLSYVSSLEPNIQKQQQQQQLKALNLGCISTANATEQTLQCRAGGGLKIKSWAPAAEKYIFIKVNTKIYVQNWTMSLNLIQKAAVK